jgi:regulatory protein
MPGDSAVDAGTAGPAGGGGPAGRAGPAGGGGEAVDPVERAREICLRQLSARACSRAELATALARRGVAPEVADAVLGRLAEVGLVDDGAFAAELVRSGREHRGLGRRALAADLARRGVDEDVGAEALEVVRPEDEQASARELLSRRRQSLERLAPPARARRIVGLLARKGYAADVVARVLADEVGLDPEDAFGAGLADQADDVG